MSVPVGRTSARRVGRAGLAGARPVTVIGAIARTVARSVAVSRWMNPRTLTGSIGGSVTIPRPVARSVSFSRLARSVAVSGPVAGSVARPIAVAWSLTRFADSGTLRSRPSRCGRIRSTRIRISRVWRWSARTGSTAVRFACAGFAGSRSGLNGRTIATSRRTAVAKSAAKSPSAGSLTGAARTAAKSAAAEPRPAAAIAPTKSASTRPTTATASPSAGSAAAGASSRVQLGRGKTKQGGNRNRKEQCANHGASLKFELISQRASETQRAIVFTSSARAVCGRP
jgi:hypothetical protein